MAELNDFVASKMMFEPSLNGSELTTSFLQGYYGTKAAPHVQEYIDTLTDRMLAIDFQMQEAGWEMTPWSPIFDTTTILRAGAALAAAHRAAAQSGDAYLLRTIMIATYPHSS